MTVTTRPEAYDDAKSQQDGESGRISRTTLAVVDRVCADLVGTPFRFAVADDFAHAIERSGRNRDDASTLDEQSALFARHEPVMATLADLAFAVAPIVDPRSGRRGGVVALTCPVEAASELMLAYVRRIRREIEEELVNATSAAERALTAHFVRVRRHVRGAVVSVNERTMLANAAAARLVDDHDRSTLWEWARQAIARGETNTEQLQLSRGITASAWCEPVEVAGATVGALVRLDPGSADEALLPGRGEKRPRRASLGWESLSTSQLGIAELIASGLTNGEVAARLYISRHTVDFHLRKVFAKLSIESRVDLARMLSERQAGERQAS